MSLAFVHGDEFQRGKGSRKIRLGPKVAIDSNPYRSRKYNTPNQMAINKLNNILTNSLGKTGTANYLRDADQLRFMNMNVLAQVLIYMRRFNVEEELIPDNFSFDKILPYINGLLPREDTSDSGVKLKKYTKEEIEVIRYRLASTFLRYIRYVRNFNLENRNIMEANIRNIVDTNDELVY